MALENSNSFADIRTEYKKQTLLETDVAKNPFEQFHIWFQQAVNSNVEEVNAMTLATATAEGVPSARIVLLKDFTKDGFVFYTNYESQKGIELAENPRASLLFFYKELERQIRIVGLVRKIKPEMSDKYFYSRPIGSQIGAIASPQSKVIKNRAWLENKEEKVAAQPKKIIRPEHWGGYILNPVSIEFWQGRPNRLHDRIQYTLQPTGKWKTVRLAP
jgi:pyridoxamine 5'-phosphate oxidase